MQPWQRLPRHPGRGAGGDRRRHPLPRHLRGRGLQPPGRRRRRPPTRPREPGQPAQLGPLRVPHRGRGLVLDGPDRGARPHPHPRHATGPVDPGTSVPGCRGAGHQRDPTPPGPPQRAPPGGDRDHLPPRGLVGDRRGPLDPRRRRREQRCRAVPRPGTASPPGRADLGARRGHRGPAGRDDRFPNPDRRGCPDPGAGSSRTDRTLPRRGRRTHRSPSGRPRRRRAGDRGREGRHHLHLPGPRASTSRATTPSATSPGPRATTTWRSATPGPGRTSGAAPTSKSKGPNHWPGA